VRLVFGLIEIADGDDGRTATTTQVAEVRMSPQHAANIVELIGAQLKGYEQKFGKIPAPHKVLSD
jgi:hypothetical protein